MSELISGKEALIALANDQEVECRDTSNTFNSLGWGSAFGLNTNLFFSDRFKFRLKPRTITVNGVELENPKSIEKPTDTSILLCFNSKSDRNVFLNTLMNRNF